MSNKRVSVIDHGVGNLQSVLNALSFLGYKVDLARSEADIIESKTIILPGVGNFGGVMKALDEIGVVASLKHHIAENKPFLGICVGMQVLYSSSDESPGINGLGLLEGRLMRLSTLQNSAITPSIGWHQLERESDDAPDLREAYFVHNYFAQEVSQDELLSTYSWNGHKIPAHVGVGRVQGVQFHPEKSRIQGLMFMDELLSQISS